MVARWILLGLAIQAEASAIFNAILQSAIGSPMQQFLGLALTVFSGRFLDAFCRSSRRWPCSRCSGTQPTATS